MSRVYEDTHREEDEDQFDFEATTEEGVPHGADGICSECGYELHGGDRDIGPDEDIPEPVGDICGWCVDEHDAVLLDTRGDLPGKFAGLTKQELADEYTRLYGGIKYVVGPSGNIVRASDLGLPLSNVMGCAHASTGKRSEAFSVPPTGEQDRQGVSAS